MNLDPVENLEFDGSMLREGGGGYPEKEGHTHERKKRVDRE